MSSEYGDLFCINFVESSLQIILKQLQLHQSVPGSSICCIGEELLHLILVGEMCDGVILQMDAGKLLHAVINEGTIETNTLCYSVLPLSNWAPVWDFQLLDYFKENQDQVFVVTGKKSRGRKHFNNTFGEFDESGAVCVIRNGIALNPILLSNQKDFIGYDCILLQFIIEELRRCGTSYRNMVPLDSWC